jgi:hypothetical protein
MLRGRELAKALELNSEMGGPPGRVYDPVSGYYKTVKGGGPAAGPFEERVDERGHVTYHRIKKLSSA